MIAFQLFACSSFLSSCYPPYVASPSGLDYPLPSYILIQGYKSTITRSPGFYAGYPDAAVFTVAPALPSGVVIDAASGVISGASSVVASEQNYTVTATNSIGSVTAVLGIVVQGSYDLKALPRSVLFSTRNF